MDNKLAAQERATQVGVNVALACTFAERLRGKLKDAPSQDAVTLLVPCRGVHTFGMGYSLDIAFVGSDDCVLASFRNVPPRKKMRCRKARYVLERAADDEAIWPREGDCVQLHLFMNGGSQ